MENLYPVLVLIAISIVFYMIFSFKPKRDREYEEHLKKSLSDEYIIDPETGTKLTLEQAESGHWIQHDNEFLTVPESEIEKFYTEEEKELERATNYLKSQRNYRKQKLTDEDVEFLDRTKILSKYQDWTYSNSFRLEFFNGQVFLPAVKLEGSRHTYFAEDYHESQLLFWLKFDINFGHYYLREKSDAERFFDMIKNDDDLKLTGYESFTFKKSENIFKLTKILEKLEGQAELEIEFIEENLLIKTTKLANLLDIQRIERVVKRL